MIKLLFKLKRRLEFVLRDLMCQFRLYQWRILYGDKLAIGKQFKFHTSLSLVFELSPTSGAMLQMGDDILMRQQVSVRVGENGNLVIGEGSFFNNRCSITCFGNIIIGQNCQFGEDVKLYDHNHFYKTHDRLIKEQGYTIGNIRIGNNCWIGSNVVILKDVIIGDNVVIGAGCIIHKSIPSNTVVINKQEQILKSY